MAAVEVPQTLEYKGGQLIAAPVLEVENFTNWKKMFMCHIIGIEPQFISNGPFVPMAAGQKKPEAQWTADERKAANLDQRLKSLIMSVLPDDQLNSVINCLIAKSTWDDLILYHERPSDVKESRVMDLKLCYNTFKFKEGESLTQTFTRYKALMNELVNDGIKLSKLEINTGFINGLPKKWLSFCQSLRNTNHVKDSELASLFGKLKYEENLIDNFYETKKSKSLVSATPLSTAFFSTSIVQDFQDSPDDEEDTRSSHEYLKDLKEEYQAKSLLAKSKRFFKKGTQSTPLLPLKKLDGVEPGSRPKTVKSILKSKSTFKAETLKGITLNEPSSAPAGGNKSSLVSKTNSALVGKLKNVNVETPHAKKDESSNPLRSKTPTKRVKQFRNAIGAHYLPHSSEYVAPPSIYVVRKWFPMIRVKEKQEKDKTGQKQEAWKSPVISSSKLSLDQTSNPTSSTNTNLKGRTRRSSKQKVENSNFEEHLPPVATMADNRTMAKMLCAPTEGYAEAIMVPSILSEKFELKHNLINMMTSEQFFGLETDNPHDHIRWGSPPVARKRTPAFHYHLDQDSLNAAVGGNLLEKSPQDALTIIENKSKVRNSRSKSIASLVKACDINSSSEIAKLTHAVNQQTSAVTTATTVMLKQLQVTPHPFPIKAVEEICVTCGGAHPYYQCLAAGGNTFPEFRDNIQGYVLAAAGNYHQGSGSFPSNTVANPKGELKAITTRSGLVTDGPTVPTPPKSVTPEVGKRVEETYTDPDLAEYIIKVPPPLVQKYKPPSQRDFVVHKRDSPLSNIQYPSRMLKQKQQEKDEVQIQKFWHMFKQLYLNITLAEALVLVPKDPGKFLISCGFSELKCKALADLGASINLMPLSVWKELGLPDLIPTRMTLELDNRAICTPDGIARDVFVPVGKFAFPADFVVVDYETDPRVPLILGRPFLRTARSLIDVHGEEMILRDDDERLTLNMKHDTTSYSNNPQRESINLINIFNVPSEYFLEVSVSNQTSGNPTFSLHQELTSPEVTHEIYDSEGCNVLSEILPDIDSSNDVHPYFDDNPLSGRTTYSSNSLLEEFTDELARITYPPDYDDNLQFDIESDLKEIEFLLYQGKDSSLNDSINKTDLANLDDYFVDPTPEVFTDEHAPDYSSPLRFDVYDDDFLEVESDADKFYDDPFDSKGEKIKESKLLIDEFDLPCDFLPYFEYDSFNS
uniref:Retrovirus-related Pol polyprotein from transposon TNT 1-94 n=1 Tax=Tanacetum cinerariifolium TaxID=118510 RepID=A0A6L2K695_TANCI|nr:retrovirus-related Pol polyprotein from transposon TNT 1-94 [Tanacetum cinerariifolium]